MKWIAQLFCINFAFGIVCGLIPVRRLDLLSTFFRNTSLVGVGLYSIFAYLSMPVDPVQFWPGILLIAYGMTVRGMPPLISKAVLIGIAVGMYRQIGGTFTGLERGSMFLGATLMGFSLVAMNIGHSYLSTVKLPIRPLRILSGAIIAILILRIVLFLYGIGLEGMDSWMAYFSSLGVEGLSIIAIVSARILFGLIGSAILSVMVWKTVEIESTQSATGILYALLSMVLVGEGSALFLMIHSKVWF